MDARNSARAAQGLDGQSWAEHLRQHKRVSHADADLQSKVLAFHTGPEKPLVQHLLTINKPGRAT